MTNQRADAELLMNELLPLAKRMLTKFGEFSPYGGYVLDDGKVVHVGLESEDYEIGSGQRRARQLEENLRQIGRTLRPLAVGMVSNVRLQTPAEGPSDAIEIDIEHRLGYSAELFLPYRLSDGKAAEVSDPAAQQGRVKRFY